MFGLRNRINKLKIMRKLKRQKKCQETYITKETILLNRLRSSTFFNIVMGTLFLVNSTLIVSVYKYETIDTRLFPVYIDIVLFIILIMGLIMLPYPFKYYGINFNKFKKNIKLGFKYGGIAFLMAFITRTILVFMGNEDQRFVWNVNIFILYYPISSMVQEIVAKGYLQTHFTMVFKERKYGKIISIFIASVFFAQFHFVYGVEALIVTFIYAVITGFIYEETKSFMGVSIIHFLAGISFFYFTANPGV